jgi:hypothetical protein
MHKRQGDILFRVVDEKPSTALKPHNSPIVAHGEVTGHAHRIMTPPMSELESYVDEEGDIWVLSKTEPIKVGHDEHSAIEMPPNKWVRITRQSEYDPVEEMQRRKVLD